MIHSIPARRRIKGPPIGGVAVLIAMLCCPLMGRAQEASVDTHLERSRAALRDGDYKTAAAAARQGLKAKKDYRLYCNLGMASEKLGHRETALRAWRSCRKSAPKSAARARSTALDHANAIEKALRTSKREYRILSTPKGATFTVDGAGGRRWKTPAKLWLSFGAHKLHFQADPKGRYSAKVVALPVNDGPLKKERVVLTDNRAVQTGPKPTDPTTTMAPPPAPAGTERAINPWPWVVAGIGAASLGVGTYFYFEGQDLSDAIGKNGDQVIDCYYDPNCDSAYEEMLLSERERKEDDLESARTIKTATFITGALLLAGGLAWGLWDLYGGDSAEDADTANAHTWHILPVVGEVTGIYTHVRF